MYLGTSFSVIAKYGALEYLVWTLLGVIFFLRSLYSKFTSLRRQQRNAAPRWEAP